MKVIPEIIEYETEKAIDIVLCFRELITRRGKPAEITQLALHREKGGFGLFSQRWERFTLTISAYPSMASLVIWDMG